MLKVCRQAGCYRKAEGRYCTEHTFANSATDQRKSYDAHRADDNIRKLYRDRRWPRTRIIVLRRDPLCTIAVLCGGTKPSTIVDHYPLSSRAIVQQFGEAEFFNPDRCRGACKADHDRKTALEDSNFAGSK